MPDPTSPRTWRPALVSAFAVLALAGCSGAPAPAPAPTSAPPASSSAVAPTATATASGTGSSAAAPTAAKPSGPPPSVPGSCGTVTAASGLTLYVFQSQGLDCAAATKLVGDFQRKIGGRQGAGSNDAVNDTVDGWLCTSGPPASQGGTTCTKGEQTVFAAVVPSE